MSNSQPQKPLKPYEAPNDAGSPRSLRVAISGK